MRIIPVGKKYDSKIYVLDEGKVIFKLDCLCPDFTFRRIKKIGEFADVRYFAKPCKHLVEYVDRLIQQGYTLKIPPEMLGSDTLKVKLRRELLERAENKCEDLNCGSDVRLQIHRKCRGKVGGKYNKLNCVVLCATHHQMRHANETQANRT